MAKLTDKQHKKIIARYAEIQNYSQVAREFGVSESTIRNHCKGDEETAKKCAQKKEQNTQDIIEFMGAMTPKIKDLLERILDQLSDPQKLARANVRDLATAYGIIVDKSLQTAPKANDELLQKAAEILGDINGVIR